MHVTGELRLRGERFDVDCLHVRDRSWNQVRTEDPGGARPHPPLGWTPICFGEDLALQTTSIEPPDSDPAWAGLYDLPEDAPLFFNSWVIRNGEPRALVEVRRTVHRYHPVLKAAIVQELEAVDGTGERYHFHGEALGMSPMHSWPNIAFRDSVMRWTDLTDPGRRVTHCTYQEIFYDAYLRGVRRAR
jgi:hypothetical protein